MATSDFWQSLASQFQALHDFHGTLRFDWHYQVGGGAVGQWRPAGTASGSICSHFESLARRAAVEIPNKETSDLLIAWLEALRQDGSNFIMGPYLIEKNEDGSEAAHYLTGSIYDACEASANFCRKLESRALQTEFEETQQPPVPQPIPPSTPEQTIAAQLQKLRDECRWTIPELAEAVGIDPRTVDRHLAGKSNPYPRTISAYERAFGKHLK
jgi:DNA-binding XRE family transcriptional regulator